MLSNARPRTLLDLIHSDLSLRCLSRRERVALGALCFCVLVLLAALQHDRVFLGDEIGTLRCLKASPTYILTHFQTWLSMNYFILVEKGVAWLCGAADWRLTLLPMAAAVAIIPLTASLALKLYRFDAYCADCRRLGRFQSVPRGVGSGDSGLFAPGGVESIGNQ